MWLGVRPTTLPCKKSTVRRPKVKPRIGNDLRKRPGKDKDNETDLKLYSWNVRTVYKSGTLSRIVEIVTDYKADITALQEVRWKGHGVLQKKDYDFYYCGHESKALFGTGFIVSKTVKSLVIDFKPVDMRISTLRIKGKFFNLTIINVHAPTEDKQDEEKDEFYDTLEKVYNDCPANDIKIIIGDLNAKVGRERVFAKQVGRHSLHKESNENGIRLVNFAAQKNMVIGSTRFEHKDIHKRTWVSPDGRVFNQIDHLLIDARHVGNLMDVRTFRGANVDSDHYLIGSKIRYRIADVKKKRGTKQIKLDVENVKNDRTREKLVKYYDENLKVSENDVRIDQEWKKCKETILKGAEKVLGRKQNVKEDTWYDDECREATTQKDDAYKETLRSCATRAVIERYKEARKTEKKIHRRKKRKFENQRMEKIELERLQNNTHRMYKDIEKWKDVFKPKMNMCRDKKGVLLTEKTAILQRWTEHFNELLNNEEDSSEEEEKRNVNSETIINNNGETEVEINPPSLQEVVTAIGSIKNNKAPGSDEIPGEVLRYGGEGLAESMHSIIKQIWKEERLPQEWNIGLICPLHKKGDALQCGNYRGITLLNTAYKVFSRVLLNRLEPYAEKIIGNYQCGFRGGRSTIDQIFTIRQALEKTVEFSIDTFHIFVDFKAAYDSINREKLYEAMEEFKIPAKLIRMVKTTMRKVISKVKIEQETAEAFETKRGLRQGDALSCTLFNLALEKVIRQAKLDKNDIIYNKSVQVLAYADDIDIIGRSLEATKEAFTNLVEAAKDMGLHINEKKTKCMISTKCRNKKKRIGQNLTIGEFNLEVVNEFVYLGTLVTDDDNSLDEINRRIMKANRAYFGSQRLLKSKTLSRKTKFLIYKTLIRPVLTYGSETWRLKKTEQNKIGTFERKILRRILGPVKENGLWRSRYNQELYELYNDIDIIKWIKINRLKWAGHVIRMSDDSAAKRMLLSKPDGQRNKGRPKMRWLDAVEEDVKAVGISNWKQLAMDRAEWRGKLEEAKIRPGLFSQ